MNRASAYMLAALLPAARALAADSAPEPPIAPDSGYTVQLCGACAFPRVMSISTSGKKVFQAKEQPKVVEAALGTERSQDLAAAFTPEWICAAPAPKPCIVQGLKLTVADSIRRAGTYTVIINLQPSSQPLLPRWKMQVVQAPAQLDVQPISVTRYRYWQSADEKPELILFNAADSARLTLTAAKQWDAASGKGTIEITEPLPDIKPKDKATLPYKLTGDFPDGKVTHTLRFEAPQLAAPATVNVEVATKWPCSYLFAAVLLGLGAGYYVKVTLRNRVELAKARVQADALLAEAEGVWNRIEDPVFRRTIEPPTAALKTARQSGSLDDIKDAHDTLAAAIKGATVSHATRLQDARKSLEGFRTVLKPDWRLPPVAAALKTARDGLAKVEEFLKVFNAKDAQTVVDALRDTLATELRQAYSHWPVVQQTVVRLADANVGIPRSAGTQMSAELENAPRDWQTIKPTPVPAADSDIAATLADYESRLAYVNGLLEALVHRLELEWNEVDKYLAPVRPLVPQPALLATLETKWKELMDELRRGGQDAEGPIDVDDVRLRGLQQAWFDGYTGQVAANTALEAQLNAREFIEATRTLAAQIPSAKKSLGGQPAPIDWQHATAAAGSGVPPPPATPAQATPWFPFLQPFEPSPTDVIRRSQLIQTAVVLLLLSVSLAFGAVTANQGAWIDLFHAFTLAFAADVTLDALLARLKT